MRVQPLLACKWCGDRHPLAYQPPRDAGTCPGCGAPTAPIDGAIEVPGVITGAKAGRAMLAIGRFFHRIAKRI